MTAIPTLSEIRRAEDDVLRSTQAIRNGVYPEKGDRVEVVRGRKVKIGTVGTFLSEGDNQYGRWVLMDVDGTNVITAYQNVVFPGVDAKRERLYEAQEDARARLSLMLADAKRWAGLDLAKPLGTVSQSSGGWSDTYTTNYACNPQCPTDYLTGLVAIMNRPQSSQGMLRWSGGCRVVDRPALDRVHISETIHMCD